MSQIQLTNVTVISFNKALKFKNTDSSLLGAV